MLPDLILTNREGLAGDVNVGSSLGSSDYKTVEFSFKEGGKEEAGQQIRL